MLGISSDDWDNLGDNAKNNWNKTMNDASNGSIMKTAGDVYKLKNNPFGGSSNSSSPNLQPAHLEEPDENGYQKINDAGLQHLQAQAAQAQIPDMPANNTPDMSQTTKQGNPGLVGSLLAAV